MANKRWSRYRTPSEVRTEDGRPRRKGPEPAKTKAKAKVIPPAASPSRSRPEVRSGRKSIGVISAVALGIVAVPVSIGLLIGANEDEASGTSEIDRGLLEEAFIADGFEDAVKAEGTRAVSVRLDEYAMRVEYFDPNENESRTVENNDYTEGYQVQVEQNHYPDYRPIPFDLAEIDPAVLIAVADETIAQTDDAYTFSLTVAVDRESGEIQIEGYASGDERITLVADVHGEVVSVEKN